MMLGTVIRTDTSLCVWTKKEERKKKPKSSQTNTKVDFFNHCQYFQSFPLKTKHVENSEKNCAFWVETSVKPQQKYSHISLFEVSLNILFKVEFDCFVFLFFPFFLFVFCLLFFLLFSIWLWLKQKQKKIHKPNQTKPNQTKPNQNKTKQNKETKQRAQGTNNKISTTQYKEYTQRKNMYKSNQTNKHKGRIQTSMIMLLIWIYHFSFIFCPLTIIEFNMFHFVNMQIQGNQNKQVTMSKVSLQN